MIKKKEKKKKTDCGTNWESWHLSASSTPTSEAASQRHHSRHRHRRTQARSQQKTHIKMIGLHTCTTQEPPNRLSKTSAPTSTSAHKNHLTSTKHSSKTPNQSHEETGPHHLQVAGRPIYSHTHTAPAQTPCGCDSVDTGVISCAVSFCLPASPLSSGLGPPSFYQNWVAPAFALPLPRPPTLITRCIVSV